MADDYGYSDEKIRTVMGQVDEVKGQMHRNIDAVLDNHEQLEVLEDKTDVLRGSAGTFQRSSTKLKRAMWWRNTKLLALIILILFVCLVTVIVVIVLIIVIIVAVVENKKSSKLGMFLNNLGEVQRLLLH